MLLRRLAGALLATLVSSTLRGQAVLTGTVVDSLSHRPLAGATVQIARDSTLQALLATTDSAGRFRLAGVAPGRYLVGFLHPLVDSLGVDLPPRHIVVSGAEQHVDLAVPAAKTLGAAICPPAQRSDSAGLLIGHLHDATTAFPLVGTVIVQWMELTIGQGGVHTGRQLFPAKTNDLGWFAMCGMPSDVDVTVSATSGSEESGVIEVRVPAGGLLVRDLRLSRADSTIDVLGDSTAPDAARFKVATLRRGHARLVGTVRNGKGQAVTNADVSVPGTGLQAHVSQTGAFALSGLPAGTQSVEIRAFGFEPKRATVDVSNDSLTTVAVILDRTVQTLGAVTIYGKSNSSLAAFDRRRRSSFGHFVTAADIERRQPIRTTDMLRTLPGVRVVPGTGFGDVVLVRGCKPTVYYNGMRMGDDAAEEIDLLANPSEVTAIEVYTSVGRPVEYWGNSCGTVVLWVGMLPR